MNRNLTADLILTNGQIHTFDSSTTIAETLAVRGTDLVYVGPNLDAATLDTARSSGARVIDLCGKTVIPGLIDAHTHPSMVVLSTWHVSLPRTDDLSEILGFLAEFAASHPVEDVPFIYAEYYDSNLDWGPPGPSAAHIDAYVSDRPVLLQDDSDHASTLNSLMLELLGVNENTPIIVNPDDHAQLFTRADDGRTPTGHVLEFAWLLFANQLWEAIGWQPPQAVTPETLAPFVKSLSEYGVTALFDAITDEHALGSAAELDRRGELNMYYHGATLFTSLVDLPAVLARLRKLDRTYGSAHVRVGTVKLFLDGTNEVGTSSVLDPFELPGHEHDHGVLRVSESDLAEVLRVLNREGIDLHIHVVGDAGFRTALNAVERVRGESGDGWRMQVTLAHAELIDPADMPRVASLGILVNWTPHWSGGYFGDAAVKWLGRGRFDRMYRFNEIIRAGGTVSFGSDVVSSYESPRANPFLGMQIAHTRVDVTIVDGDAEKAPMPRTALDARLERDVLVRGYTRNAAEQLRLLDTCGSIESGKRANLVVLDRDIFGVSSDDIHTITPHLVVFEGDILNDNPNGAHDGGTR